MSESENDVPLAAYGNNKSVRAATEQLLEGTGAVQNESIATTTQNPFGNEWENISLTFNEWAILLVGVVAFWILISFLLAFFLGPDFVTCYLCNQQVPRKFWMSGEHRIECAKNHAKFIEDLPCPDPSNRCPICHRPLRLWPSPDVEPPQEFVCLSHRRCCDLDEKGAKKAVINNNENRMTCFNCDYDICNRCALAKDSAPLLSLRSVSFGSNGGKNGGGRNSGGGEHKPNGMIPRAPPGETASRAGWMGQADQAAMAPSAAASPFHPPPPVSSRSNRSHRSHSVAAAAATPVNIPMAPTKY